MSGLILLKIIWNTFIKVDNKMIVYIKYKLKSSIYRNFLTK
jgi:hypothetical protein